MRKPNTFLLPEFAKTLPGLSDQVTPPQPYGLPAPSQLPAPEVAPVPTTPVRPKRSLMDVLLPGGEGLSRDDRKSGQLSGAIAGGLALLAAAGPHSAREIQPNLGQGLLGALTAGREASRTNFEALYSQQDAEALQRSAVENAAMFRGLGIGPNDTDDSIRAKLQQGFMFAMQSGNAKAATSISEVLKSMGAKSGGQRGKTWTAVDMGGGRTDLVDDITGETIRSMQGKATTGAGGLPPKPELYEVSDGKGGSRRIMGYWDAANQRVVEVPGLRPPPEKVRTEAQGKAKAFIPSVRDDVSLITDVLTRSGVTDKFLASVGGQSTLAQFLRADSPEAQLLAGASGTLAEAWLRMTTGAAYNAEEYQNAMARYSIYPTDSAEMVKWKLGNMQSLQDMLHVISGDPNLELDYEFEGRREAPMGALYNRFKGPPAPSLEQAPPSRAEHGSVGVTVPGAGAAAVDALIGGSAPRGAHELAPLPGLQMKPYAPPQFQPKPRPPVHTQGR